MGKRVEAMRPMLKQKTREPQRTTKTKKKIPISGCFRDLSCRMGKRRLQRATRHTADGQSSDDVVIRFAAVSVSLPFVSDEK